VTPPASRGLVGRFRALIALEAALTVASLIASVTLRRTLPVPLQEFLRADDDAPARALAIAAAVGVALVMAMMVAAWIGLWRFWKVAPPLLLASWIGVGAVTLLAGPTVQTAAMPTGSGPAHCDPLATAGARDDLQRSRSRQ